MSPTTQGPESGEPTPAGTGPEGSSKERSGRHRGSHDTITFVIWSALILLLGLGLFYGWRTITNRERLTDRNLRELDRMGLRRGGGQPAASARSSTTRSIVSTSSEIEKGFSRNGTSSVWLARKISSSRLRPEM